MLDLDAPAAPLQPGSPEPLWRQTARAIERDIAAAKLPSGSRLPPERDFLTKLAISRVTLRKALHSLVESGVLVSSHGRGWYVAVEGRKEFPPTLESFSETAARLGLTASSDVVKAGEAPATLDEAEELSVAPGSPIFHLERVRRLDGVPAALDVSYFPAIRGLDVSGIDFRSASLFRLLIEAGVNLSRADCTVEARAADAELARCLGIEPGMPVLAMRQRIEDSAMRPVCISNVTYAGNRYRLRTSFSRIGSARA